IPWHACALGHAIVAHQPAPEQSRALAADLTPLTGQTKTSRSALNRAPTQVRRQGYALEDQEATVGDGGIAAPIFGRDAVVAGSVGVVGAADRLLAPASRPTLIRAVQDAARAISRDLGAGRGDTMGPAGSRLSALS